MAKALMWVWSNMASPDREDEFNEWYDTVHARDVLDNVEGIVPTGLNRALAVATGEVIIRVDGHAVVPRDYVRRCVDVLLTSGADCAGGVIDTVGEGTRARAIAAAQASPFGVGNE